MFGRRRTIVNRSVYAEWSNPRQRDRRAKLPSAVRWRGALRPIIGTPRYPGAASVPVIPFRRASDAINAKVVGSFTRTALSGNVAR